MKFSTGTLSHEKMMRSIELYGTQVQPLVRDMLVVNARGGRGIRTHDAMTDAGTRAASTLSERLDRLPFTRRHLRVLTGLGARLGAGRDGRRADLVRHRRAGRAVGACEPSETAWIASIGFIGMAIGASVGGLLADRFGRRQVFAVTLLVYGLATGASALVGGLAALLVLRFLVGLGLGAELPVASTYVSEFAPARIRGRLIVILEAFWAVGWTAAALIGYLVIPASDNGWRWAFALGAIPAAYALVVRWGLPESARWLERRGRHAEADAVVRSFEESAGSTAAGDRRGRRADAAPAGRAVRRAQRLAALWSRGVPRAHRVPVAGLVLRQLLVLRRVHLDPVDPRRRRATTWCAPSGSR